MVITLVAAGIFSVIGVVDQSLQDLLAEVSRIPFRKHQVRSNSDLEARTGPEGSEYQCVPHRDERLGEIARGSRRYPFPQTTPSWRSPMLVHAPAWLGGRGILKVLFTEFIFLYSFTMKAKI